MNPNNDVKNLQIHPITKTYIVNDKNKFMALPHGPTNKIEDQKLLSKTDNNITDNAQSLFFSDSYFFTAIFNANTFDEKITLVNNIIDSEHNIQTVSFIMVKLITTIDDVSDKKIEELIKVYDKYYKVYENKTLSYGELYDLIKDKITK